MRWFMFWFCVTVVVGMWGWGFYLLFTDVWMGEHMMPLLFLLSLPTALMACFWYRLATGKI